MTPNTLPSGYHIISLALDREGRMYIGHERMEASPPHANIVLGPYRAVTSAVVGPDKCLYFAEHHDAPIVRLC